MELAVRPHPHEFAMYADVWAVCKVTILPSWKCHMDEI
jgi:hypothetical protein